MVRPPQQNLDGDRAANFGSDAGEDAVAGPGRAPSVFQCVRRFHGQEGVTIRAAGVIFLNNGEGRGVKLLERALSRAERQCAPGNVGDEVREPQKRHAAAAVRPTKV
jgi:hypothetical protein